MAKRLAIFVLVPLCLFAQTVVAFAADFPEPEGFVNEFANILNPETKQTLEQQLVQLEEDSSIEISVVTAQSLEGTTIDDYAVRLFENWGIGKESEDNGILLLIYPNDRIMRIEVGYGLEPLLTDSKAGRIIRNIIAPEFKDENYDQGVTEGVAAIIGVVRGEEVDLGDAVPSGSEEEEGDGLWVLFVIGVIFLSYLSSFLSRSKRWWPGGVIGAILGIILGGFMASLIVSILAAFSLGILGLIFDFVLSKNYKKRKVGGLPTSWWSSGGGFFGSAKGGSGGGSFGGFGGGRSGGGGASGGW